MKTLITLLFSFFLSHSIALGANGWMTDFKAAQAKAKKENKALLVDFSGSDWCHICKILDKEVFSKKEFVTAAQKDFVLVELDFPRVTKQNASLKKQNTALAKKYKIQAFPTVLLMNADGSVFKTTGYQKGGVKPYLSALKKSLKAKKML